jgi:hypothetical protein
MTLLAFTLLSKPALAGCHLVSTPADPLTGNRIDAAPLKPDFRNMFELDHHSAPTGSKRPWTMTWGFSIGGVHRELLSNTDTKLQLALASGDKLEASLLADATPVPYAGGGVTMTYYSTVFALTEDDVAKLAQSPMILIRIDRSGDPFVSYDAQKNKRGKFARFPHHVQCLRDTVAQ